MPFEFNIDEKIKNCLMNHPNVRMTSSQIAFWIKENYSEEINQRLGHDFLSIVTKIQKMIEEALYKQVYFENERIYCCLNDEGKKSYQFVPFTKSIFFPLFEEKLNRLRMTERPPKEAGGLEQTRTEKPLFSLKGAPKKHKTKKDNIIIKAPPVWFKKQTNLALRPKTVDFYRSEYEDDRYKNTDELKRYLRQNDVNQIRTEERFERIKEIIDTMSEFRFEAEEKASQNDYRFSDKRKELPISWEQIEDLLTKQEDADQPPRRLITKIAEKISLIERTVAGLRKVLTRERKKVNISQAQQLDSQCIRWLIKQPGISPAQKAGAKQQIMAVIRQETYNTLENRVLKDFLKRAHNEAEQYLRLFSKKTKFAKSQRIQSVKRLCALCVKSLSMPEMQNISPLYEMPHPNYVLQQNPNYAQIWNFYRRLLHQTRLTELIWSKRHLVVYEHLLFWIAAHLRFNLSNFEKTFFSDLWILDSAENGFFFKSSKWHYFLENGTDFYDFAANIKYSSDKDFSIRTNNSILKVIFVFIPSFVSSFNNSFDEPHTVYIFYNESALSIPKQSNFLEINKELSFGSGLSEVFSSLMELLS